LRWIKVRGFGRPEGPVFNHGRPIMKTFALTTAIVLALSGASSAFAQDVQTGSVQFSGNSVAVGVGYTWAKGVLTFNGHDYPFKAKGLSVLGVGAEKITGQAEVYHLTKASDFAGVYAAAAAGGSVADAGGGTAVLRNRKGVVVRVHTQDKGLALNIAASGVGVTLDKK
jgi:hypothetical protein